MNTSLALYHPADTIAAIATAPGVGGLAVIRVSGTDAIEIVDKLFRGSKPLTQLPVRIANYGRIIVQGKEMDDVVLTVFSHPNSYTGEDVVEISCHGSLFLQEQLMRALLAQGCRQAGPGEFTMRAYMNGKMDLSEAEAVADLIAARSEAANNLARKQLNGTYSRRLNEIAEELIQFASMIELELDFGEEDVEFADRSALLNTLTGVKAEVEQLLSSYAAGNVIKHGLPIAIVGATNAGKSTLLNTLVGHERAIVSDIAGTTRDTIEETLNLGGIEFRIVDTAGIRSTDDQIEALGIERSLREIDAASIVLYLIDVSQALPNKGEILSIIERSRGKDLLILTNKIDLPSCVQSVPSQLQVYPQIAISAKAGIGIEELTEQVVAIAKSKIEESDVIVSNTRHYEALRLALAALLRVDSGLRSGLSSDLVVSDLRDAIAQVEEITGRRITADTILHNIFANFCIGK